MMDARKSKGPPVAPEDGAGLVTLALFFSGSLTDDLEYKTIGVNTE